MQAWKTGWWQWWEEAKVVVVMVEVAAAAAVLAANGEGSRVGGRRSRHELPWQVHYLLHRRPSTHTPYSHIRLYICIYHTRTHTKNDTSSLRVFRQTRDKRFSLSSSLFFSFFSVTFSSRFPLRFWAFPSASRLTRSDIARFSPLSRVDSCTRVHLSIDWRRINGGVEKRIARNFTLIGL